MMIVFEFIFYNHRKKKSWDTLSDLGENGTPLPRRSVVPSRVVRSLARSPNIDLIGAGMDYGKSENSSAFNLTMSCLIFYCSGEYGESCNKLHQVYQLFFSRIVASNNCFSHKNVFKKCENSLSKLLTIVCQKAQNFALFGPYDFVQI